MTPAENENEHIEQQFIFDQKEKEIRKDINTLNAKINNLENLLANSLENIKAAFDEDFQILNSKTTKQDSRVKDLEGRIAELQQSSDCFKYILEEIEQMKSTNETLEEERK